jgi:hypothetical protein
MLVRVVLLAVAIFVAVAALRFRLLQRPLIRDFFDDGEVHIDVSGIEHTHRIGTDSLNTAGRSADGKLATRLAVRNDGSIATKYSFTTQLKSGSPEVYDRLDLAIRDEEGHTRWAGPAKDVGYEEHFTSVLPAQHSEELSLELSQADLNMQGDVEVEFSLYANPLGSDVIPDLHYQEIVAPGYWQDTHPRDPD